MNRNWTLYFTIIYYLTEKLADGAAYVDCMLGESLRQQLAKKWQIQEQGTLHWT